VAINSSSPVAGAAALSAKAASGPDAKGKLPAFGPGTPAYPPDRLPPQPRGASTPQASPGTAGPQTGPGGPTAPGKPVVTASTDPHGALPANNPFPLTPNPATAAGAAAKPISAARARPKAAAPAQFPEAAALPTQTALPIASASPEPAAASAFAPADSSSAPPAAVDPSRALPSTLASFATDLPVNIPARPAARGPAFPVAASPDDSAPGASLMAPAVTQPAGLPLSDPAHATPVKSAVATALAADDPSPRSLDTTTHSEAPADPSVAGFDVAAAHILSDPPAAAAPLPVQTPVGASGWTEEIGTHVIWMAHQGVSAASLRLQPEHLGPLEVRISLHDSTASVWFGANEPETRTALQAALPQLKEMFAAQGMTLTDAGVSREPPRDTQLPRAATPSSGAPAATMLESSAALPGVRRGLVDTYA
jgi:flagellar hook-length control protein FliK